MDHTPKRPQHPHTVRAFTAMAWPCWPNMLLTRQQVTRAPGPVPGIGTKITAVTDPDGFKTVLVDEVDIEKELEEEKA